MYFDFKVRLPQPDLSALHEVLFGLLDDTDARDGAQAVVHQVVQVLFHRNSELELLFYINIGRPGKYVVLTTIFMCLQLKNNKMFQKFNYFIEKSRLFSFL